MERGRSRKISLADLHVFPEPPARLRLTGFGVTKYGRGEDLQPPAVRHVPILVEAEAGPGLDEAGRPSTEHSGGRAGQKVVPGHQARWGRGAGVSVIMSPDPSLSADICQEATRRPAPAPGPHYILTSSRVPAPDCPLHGARASPRHHRDTKVTDNSFISTNILDISVPGLSSSVQQDIEWRQ